MRTKDYLHFEKASNRGDVIKHTALVAVLDDLLPRHNQDKPFLFADIYSGAGTYVLPPGHKGRSAGLDPLQTCLMGAIPVWTGIWTCA